MYLKYFKRLLDLTFSSLLIIFFFPIMILIFFLVWFKIGFPIFKQKRPGLNNKIFTLYKFKTLYDPIQSDSEEFRQSKLGNFLRKTGLDELPQLFNILANQMSLIGPRPLLTEYLKKYSPVEKQRHLVKPGITGLAQVSTDSSGLKSWKKSIDLDIYYVRHVSFFLDIQIIYKTIFLIFTSKKQYKDFNKFYE